MNKNKILVVITFLIIIVVGILYINKKNIGYLPINTKTETVIQNDNINIEYSNTDYGFGVSLPSSWTGYSIITSKWEGYSLTEVSDKGQVITETGPMVSIRHPLWTSAVPRQDIPVMVFTMQQWNDLQAEKFHIGAAPIGPSELGRNTQYVFALPARYNFAFPVGYEEVEKIISNKPLHVLSNSSASLLLLNDPGATYLIEKSGDRFILIIERPTSSSQSVFVSLNTTISLESFVGKSVIISGKFTTETRQVQCVRAPCPPITFNVVKIDSIRLK